MAFIWHKKSIQTYLFSSVLLLFTIFDIPICLACKVTVFDCAQGNTVVAKYKKQTMVFDAGRTGSSRFVAHEDDKSGESSTNVSYPINSTTDVVKKLEVPSSRYNLKSIPENNQVYRKEFIEEFKNYVLGEKKENTLKAVFISHPDIDHYNLVALADLKPNLFVLGGKYSLYKPPFKKHLRGKDILVDNQYGLKGSLKRFNENKKFIDNRSFGEEDDDPQIQLLSVNAGKTGRDNGEKNRDSLIVKISQNHSMLIPGDAEGVTWEDAVKNFNQQKLVTDVLLLSHHGSNTNGSTTADLLNKIKPKVCLISAGFQHNHPTSEVIKNSSYQTPPHFVTYQEGSTRKAIITDAPIFTTIDNGALTVDLSSDKLSVECSRDFTPAPNVSLFDKKETQLSLEYTGGNFINFSDIKKLNNQKRLNNDTPFGDDIYRIPAEDDEEEYYYKMGNTYLQMDLMEEKAKNNASVAANTTISNWIANHQKVYKVTVEFKGVFRLAEEIN